ncbi:MAG TPA: glycoside hydrolase family 57 protein [Candidatus Udaeobacter sp.]|jgi:alpha-amylase/alpha-mannosidase (GH57 family)|nr:glycoside hydrolase family 57 protein [Candidatus Udaeobacter sp.]
MSAEAPVDLVLLWHHHQPDYRLPKGGAAVLPWVRLHATKDYLDMALRLGRHPRLRSVFNFVPSLLDQLDDASRGGRDLLFELLGRAPSGLSPEERLEVTRRAGAAPSWAFERWPSYQTLARRAGAGEELDDDELIALECAFLLAWLDPMFHGDAEAAAALAAMPRPSTAHRDGLLELHRRRVAEVIPAYRDLAGKGQIEVTTSAYDHPILPLLVDSRQALRARPATVIPDPPFVAPEDADAQIARALERHAAAFGAKPDGLWPPEGSVSPEALAIAARRGVRWVATDEAVLWRTLGANVRGRESLYRPWKLGTEAGEIGILFRDHELSDRIGFVYQRWNAREAAEDLLSRITQIGRDHAGASPPLVSLILDGENCWEHYADDGGPFLDTFFDLLDQAPHVRTRLPRDVFSAGEAQPLPGLHTGSWIDADFHIWIGHPEKNRAWELLGRARRALIDAGHAPERGGPAWESLHAAEGSDWFWWFGDDHATLDRALFDRLFREHVIAVYERAGLEAPGALHIPISGAARGADAALPIGPLSPVIDGHQTSFYEWHEAGVLTPPAGGSMHRAERRLTRLHYGLDSDSLFLRLDPAGPIPDVIEIEFLAPRALRIRVSALNAAPRIERIEDSEREPLAGAHAAAGRLIEIALPRAPLGLEGGTTIALIVHVIEDDRPVESLPEDDALRFIAPGKDFAAEMWNA